jgi:gliding motility-associated-like protein
LIVKFDAKAQALFYSNGATIVNSTILKINGNFENANNGIFQQEDSLYIKGDFVNNAQFNNSGNIYLEGNFTNNGILNANVSGQLQLIGTIQSFQGDSTIHLNHIAAHGNGKKLLLRNVQTRTLDINDKEISLNNNILFVSDANVNALTRTTGFVSATFQGALKRKLIANNIYEFPLGWNAIYSPITISIPSDSSEIAARFAFADASSEGLPRSFLDSSICFTNPAFYHLINGTGNAGYDISIKIDSLSTVPFTHICTRALNGTATWQVDNNLNSTTTSNMVTFSGFENGAINKAFLLCRKRPQQPNIIGDTSVCNDNKVLTYTADNFGNNDLLWSAAGGQILSSAIGASINLVWTDSIAGNVSLTSTDNLGCSSLPTSLFAVVHPLPNAQIQIEAPPYLFEDEVFTFTNVSSGAPFYNWYVGDEGPISDSTFKWTFDEPGNYTITLFTTNSFGCTDTAQKIIYIDEGIIFPNSFSPNSDGINDVLEFKNSGIGEYSLFIYDRWGSVVFESRFSKLSWNGRTVSGDLVPAGTYFYVIKAAIKENKIEKRGTVSIYY